MPMTLVGTVELPSSTTNSIQFTNIPQTGKELIAVASCRSTVAGIQDALALFINDVTTASYNEIRLRGLGGSTNALQSTGSTRIQYPVLAASGATANIFGNTSYRFLNYTNSNHKQIVIESVGENNAASAHQIIVNGYLNTSAITKLEFADISGNVFVQYSSISLYILS